MLKQFVIVLVTDLLSGLVIRVLSDTEVLVSISSATEFSEKQWVFNGVQSY
jgi:hypothetical protein